MPYYTVQAVIPTVDNVAANYATNTWHFFAATVGDLTSVFTALQDFYIVWAANLSELVRQTNWEFKAYDDDDPEPRAPVDTFSFNLSGAPSGDSLPTEVALVMSFQADPVSGTPQARRRGRVYLPFLDASTNDTTARPSSALLSAVETAGQGLLDDSIAGDPDWRWVTRSKVAPGYATVTNGWIDNEWDTQRRRGRDATSRSVFN
uniref:Uncharacterized protein n=1 Tax=uncultured prokaryote TaxID=198431 RepID=A0A0H5Q791_9ZZZZ|nr:hypothetical protein [uncultured prokaryote]